MNGPRGKVGQWVSELLRAQPLLKDSWKEPACLLLITAEPAGPMQTGQPPDSVPSWRKQRGEAGTNMCDPFKKDTASISPLPTPRRIILAFLTCMSGNTCLLKLFWNSRFNGLHHLHLIPPPISNQNTLRIQIRFRFGGTQCLKTDKGSGKQPSHAESQSEGSSGSQKVLQSTHTSLPEM